MKFTTITATLNIRRYEIQGIVDESISFEVAYKGYIKSINQRIDAVLAASDWNVQHGTEIQIVDLELIIGKPE